MSSLKIYMDTAFMKPMEYKGALLKIKENSHERIQLFRPTQDVALINLISFGR